MTATKKDPEGPFFVLAGECLVAAAATAVATTTAATGAATATTAASVAAVTGQLSATVPGAQARLDGTMAPTQGAGTLDVTLADAGKAWKIVFFHQPVYSTAKGRDNKALRERLRPLFEKHGVHLVLQGHDHCYGRTHKCAGDRIVRPDEPGVVYVTAVLGPKLYDLAPKYAQLMARQYDKTRTVQAIRVTPDTLEYRSLGLDGALLDQFSLVRSADGTATELREM